MSALMFLGASLGFALLFNVAWAWDTGVLSIIAAATCTLIVPAGLHLWPQIPADRWYRRVPRDLVMTGVCLAALIVSFRHSVEVLQAAGWTAVTAWSVVGGVELMVALSTMARVGRTTQTEPDQCIGEPAEPRTVGELAEDLAVPAERVTADVGAAVVAADPDQPDRSTGEPDRTNRPDLSTDAETDLVAELARTIRSGEGPPSSNDLIGQWRIGRTRANRVLESAAAEAERTELRAVSS